MRLFRLGDFYRSFWNGCNPPRLTRIGTVLVFSARGQTWGPNLQAKPAANTGFQRDLSQVVAPRSSCRALESSHKNLQPPCPTSASTARTRSLVRQQTDPCRRGRESFIEKLERNSRIPQPWKNNGKPTKSSDKGIGRVWRAPYSRWQKFAARYQAWKGDEKTWSTVSDWRCGMNAAPETVSLIWMAFRMIFSGFLKDAATSAVLTDAVD